MADQLPEIQRIERLIPLADALACIERTVEPVAPRRIELAAALGRTPADPPPVAKAHPPAAIALRDGFAVAAEAMLDASSYAPATLRVTPVEVGDPMPAGTDAVAPADVVEMRGSTAQAVASLAPGDGVLPAGADGAAGDRLLRGTRRLRASDLATLALFGVTHLEVREPRICIVAADAAPDTVVEAIVGMISRKAEAAGSVVIAPPGRGGLAAALDAPNADAVIVIGGSGSGQRDQSVRGLARRGRILFHGVGLTPGETVAFGVVETRPVLIVPGRLDAALAVWLVLGCRMLGRLSACTENNPIETAVLARKITSTLGLAELVLVTRQGETVMPIASGYLPAQALSRADGFVLVSAALEGFPEGASVTMELLQ